MRGIHAVKGEEKPPLIHVYRKRHMGFPASRWMGLRVLCNEIDVARGTAEVCAAVSYPSQSPCRGVRHHKPGGSID
jgi:hypothetical protein